MSRRYPAIAVWHAAVAGARRSSGSLSVHVAFLVLAAVAGAAAIASGLLVESKRKLALDGIAEVVPQAA